MEEKKSLVRNKKQMFIIIGAFILTLLLGTVTYAFFNYTRTGSANTIRTGRIAFNSEQGTAINLTDMFPIDTTVNGIMDDNTKVGSVTINVTGDTNYSEGIEYLVSAVGVTNTVGSGQNQKTLPISISVSVANNTENDPATNLGTADESYFTNRGGSSSIYKVLATDTITNNEKLVVGYIAPGATGVDGNIVIKAYLDKTKVAISDTYPEEETDTNNDGYIDGTPSSFGEEKTVLTTDEWNSLQTNGISFQIKVESQEGTWVEDTTPPTIPSCPGCKFMYTTNEYQYGGANNANATLVSSLTGVTNDYREVVTNDRTYFLGFTETQDGKIDRAFACGIYGDNSNDGIPFCLEGATDESTYTSNKNVLDGVWANKISLHDNCSEMLEYGPEYTCTSDNVDAGDYYDGVETTFYSGYCMVYNNNTLSCTRY